LKTGQEMNRIAIVSYNLYAYLFLPEKKISGGAELQLATLLGQLTATGYEVYVFTGDFGQAERESRDGCTFIKLGRQGDSRLAKLQRFRRNLKAIKPSFVLERGTSAFSVFSILVSKSIGIPYIFCSASDINFAKNAIDPSFGESRLKQWLYHKCLRWVAHFVVQKNGQAKLLERNFGITRNVSVIKNFPPASIPPHEEIITLNVKPEYDAIWVANLIPYKQPELFIRLAAKYPSQRFLMIGASPDEEYGRQVLAAASGINNLTMAGYVPPDRVMGWMLKSRIVVNTTKVGKGYEEGFSNVQLMGWACGLPSLTLISDPDNLIMHHGMGLRSESFEKLCQDFLWISQNKEVYDQMRINAMKYARTFHDPEVIFKQYLKLLQAYGRNNPAVSTKSEG